MESVPTIEDAIALLTEPSYSAMGRTTDDPVEMRAGDIIRALEQRGADEKTARLLVGAALEQLGGHSEVRHRRGGLRAGGPVTRSSFHAFVPADRLRRH